MEIEGNMCHLMLNSVGKKMLTVTDLVSFLLWKYRQKNWDYHPRHYLEYLGPIYMVLSTQDKPPSELPWAR